MNSMPEPEKRASPPISSCPTRQHWTEPPPLVPDTSGLTDLLTALRLVDRFSQITPFERGGRLQLSPDQEAQLGRSNRRRPRSSSQASDGSSESSSSGGRFHRSRSRSDLAEEEGEDASPFPDSDRPLQSRRNYTLDTTPLRPVVASVLSTLGWTAARATSALSGQGDRRDGFARMFWGLRDSERTGGIRLGEQAPPPPPPTSSQLGSQNSRLQGNRAQQPVPQGKAARVLGYGGGLPTSPRFELDDDDDDGSGDFRAGEREHDAVELPSQFSVPSSSRSSTDRGPL